MRCDDCGLVIHSPKIRAALITASLESVISMPRGGRVCYNYRSRKVNSKCTTYEGFVNNGENGEDGYQFGRCYAVLLSAIIGS
jgi:hypothetical protein